MSDWIYNESGPISTSGVQNNARIIRERLTGAGWSIQAVSAILANMQVESGINPGAWENYNVGNLSGGFGLVQWTPATKLFDWQGGQNVDGDKQLDRIFYELQNGIQYGDPGGEFKEKTFEEFARSDKRPGYLSAEFMLAYERPLKRGWKQQMTRARIAERWYSQLTGVQSPKWIPLGLLIIMQQKDITRREI